MRQHHEAGAGLILVTLLAIPAAGVYLHAAVSAVVQKVKGGRSMR